MADDDEFSKFLEEVKTLSEDAPAPAHDASKEPPVHVSAPPLPFLPHGPKKVVEPPAPEPVVAPVAGEKRKAPPQFIEEVVASAKAQAVEASAPPAKSAYENFLSRTGAVMPVVGDPSKAVRLGAKVDKEKEDDEGSHSAASKTALTMAAGGQVWEDKVLAEWDDKWHVIFVGDLGDECTDSHLHNAFSHYPSLQKSRVIINGYTMKPRGYGFVAFEDPRDFLKALKEMDGKYVAGRPMKLRKSTWKKRVVADEAGGKKAAALAALAKKRAKRHLY